MQFIIVFRRLLNWILITVFNQKKICFYLL